MIGISAQLAGNDRSWIGEFALSMSNQYRFGITLLGRFAGPSFDVFFFPSLFREYFNVKIFDVVFDIFSAEKGLLPVSCLRR